MELTDEMDIQTYAQYIIIGNGVIAFLISFFYVVVQKFMNGLRLMETETIIDHCRWNVTETCIALTMFRQQLNCSVIVLFLCLVLVKCLHWAVDLRCSHLRMTEDAFYLDDSDDLLSDFAPTAESKNIEGDTSWYVKAFNLVLPNRIVNMSTTLPRMRKNHILLVILMALLYIFDLVMVTFCVSRLIKDGPNVFIIFLFEAAVLTASIMSSLTLYGIHFFDGVVSVLQRYFLDKDEEKGNEHNESNGDVDAVTPTNEVHAQLTIMQITIQKLATIWRDQRITATFFVELMALAAKFLFHLALFTVIFTLYGLPLNILRDFYMAFMKLKSRLVAFASYRELTRNMNTRFKSVTTEKELEEAGRTCIICRDQMELEGMNGDCKRLPVCHHVFHKHCLREWLVQQQTCPTCRADIQKNEATAAVMEAEREAEGSIEANTETENDETAAENDTQGEKSSVEKTECVQSIEKANMTAAMNTPCTPTPSLCRVLNEHVDVPIFDSHFNVIRNIRCGTIIICYVDQTMQRSDQILVRTLDGWIHKDDIVVCTELIKGMKEPLVSPPTASVLLKA
jgi:E3 ubiquitin-protein ligase synoviolin